MATITELAEQINTLEEMIVQQEPAVAQIDQGAERVAEDLGNANTQLDTAITSARKARKWKWYALLIVSKCSLPSRQSYDTYIFHQSSLLPSSWLLQLVSLKRTSQDRHDVRCTFRPCYHSMFHYHSNFLTKRTSFLSGLLVLLGLVPGSLLQGKPTL